MLILCLKRLCIVMLKIAGGTTVIANCLLFFVWDRFVGRIFKAVCMNNTAGVFLVP